MSTISSYLAPVPFGRLAAVLAAWMLLYPIALAVYRLTFSPLARFPGPKIAAATGWYQFYYDFFCSGKYIFAIESMHRSYGPIVRINPHELSINDPDAYNDIYVSESRRRTEAYEAFAKGMDFDGCHVLTKSHDLHRRRRKPFEPFFSRLGVSRLHHMLADVVGKFTGRLEALKGTKSVIRLDHAFSAFSGDIICRICCGDREEFLDDPNFSPEWHDLIHVVIRSIPLFTGFPLLVRILGFIPKSLLLWAFSSSQSFTDFTNMARKHILEAKHAKLESDSKSEHTDNQVSVYRCILDSDMPESELSDDRLTKEAQVFLSGGTATTARTLGFITYYILANPLIHVRLKEELKDTMAEYPQRVPSWSDLEKLPYLHALVKEGLRLSYGALHVLPRCSPDGPIQYKQWTIPTGIPVGMSAYLMHTDPVVYPKPFEFIPERWLGDIDPAMNRNWVPFCRGSRNCLGMNLAQAEIFLLLAALFRPDGPQFELFETDESDVIQAHDFMVGLPKLDTKGVRVLMR